MEFDNVVTGIMEINSSDGREYLQQPKMFYLCWGTVRRAAIENNSVAGWWLQYLLRIIPLITSPSSKYYIIINYAQVFSSYFAF